MDNGDLIEENFDLLKMIMDAISEKVAVNFDHEVLFGNKIRKARDFFEEAVKKAIRKYKRQLRRR